MRALWAASCLFLALGLVFAVLPRTYSQEAISYFGEEYLEKAGGRAVRGRVASGVNTFAVFLFLNWVSKKNFLAKWFGSNLRPGAKGAFGLGLGEGILVAVLLALISFPASLYVGHILEKQYGLTGASFGVWFSYYLKSFALDLAVYGVAGGVVAWVLIVFPRKFPWVLTLGFLLASIFVAFFYPTVIAPWFDKFYPLEDGEILAGVEQLSQKAGMTVDKVLVMEASAKTTRVNAYFAGVGSTRQVVLYDTLLKTHSADEVKLVLAHEMGHWKHGHVIKGILVGSLGVLVVLLVFRAGIASFGSGTGSYSKLESVLLLLLAVSILSGYVLSPISVGISRQFEIQADKFSLDLTGDPGTFVSTQMNLARGNLSDVEPPAFIRWFSWTHPTTMERIGMAGT